MVAETMRTRRRCAGDGMSGVTLTFVIFFKALQKRVFSLVARSMTHTLCFHATAQRLDLDQMTVTLCEWANSNESQISFLAYATPPRIIDNPTGCHELFAIFTQSDSAR